MQRFGRAKCPYCGKKVGLLNTWTIKKQGEYRCPRCEGISNVTLDILVPVLAAAAIVIALFSFIVNRVGGYPATLATFLWILIPFLVFSILSLFLVHLRRPVLHKVEKKGPVAPAQTQEVRVYQPNRAVQTAQKDEKTQADGKIMPNDPVAQEDPQGPEKRYTTKM